MYNLCGVEHQTMLHVKYLHASKITYSYKTHSSSVAELAWHHGKHIRVIEVMRIATGTQQITNNARRQTALTSLTDVLVNGVDVALERADPGVVLQADLGHLVVSTAQNALVLFLFLLQ